MNISHYYNAIRIRVNAYDLSECIIWYRTPSHRTWLAPETTAAGHWPHNAIIT